MNKLLRFRILFCFCVLCAANPVCAEDDGDDEKSFGKLTDALERMIHRSVSGQHLAEFMTEIGDHLPRLSTIVQAPQGVADYLGLDYLWLLRTAASWSMLQVLLAKELSEGFETE